MNWIILITITIIVIIEVINRINQRKVIKIFKDGNTTVSGLRGRGKDLLFCWVINKRKENYISNVNYSNPKKKFKRFNFDTKVWELAGNTYENLADGKVKKYIYPYPDGIDYYISDAGVYFPSQYHKELDKKYKGAPMFEALSRHLGDCNVHTNTQRQGRLWDKMREQSDQYIVMRGAKFFLRKFFVLSLSVYSKEESAENQIKKPFFGIGKAGRQARLAFEAANGEIKNIRFISKLPYNYDSRRFKKILENNLKDYENEEEKKS